jgi:hypothetical protein
MRYGHSASYVPDIDVLYGWTLKILPTGTAQKISEPIQSAVGKSERKKPLGRSWHRR